MRGSIGREVRAFDWDSGLAVRGKEGEFSLLDESYECMLGYMSWFYFCFISKLQFTILVDLIDSLESCSCYQASHPTLC